MGRIQGVARNQAPRLWVSIALLAFVAGCAGSGPGTGAPSTSTLEAGPGSGFLTSRGAALRPLRSGVIVTPIASVGDTLYPTRPLDETYVFYPYPAGLGGRAAGNGLIEVYATHELGWQSGVGGARVSRLLLNQRSAGVLNADYLLDGTEGYAMLSSAMLVGAREGFLGPTLLVGESSTDGPRHGVVGAIDVRVGTVTELRWMGHFRHGGTMVLRHSSGSVVAIETEAGLAGYSQLWMYLANSATDLLTGHGRLYVLRADPPSFGPNTGYASMASRTRPLSGRFVPCDNPDQLAVARQPAELSARAEIAGSLHFVRLRDVEADPDRSDSFYFTDAGAPSPADPQTGRPVTGKGRLYRAELDPLDPTRLTRLEVVLDGDEEDDVFRPDNIAAGDNGLMIQENPGGRGLHPARILRYDPLTRRLDPVAECAERDAQGRLVPQGTGGAWESTGIIDASEMFGVGAWLVSVQAPTDWTTSFGGNSGGGQLILLRAPFKR
ncbi:MAG TPA: hypothetical protein VK123_09210 [Candidatus Limnocylindrales bacterium]|nr:hypothetical protein [Candidatus Limnocylindrales bacterium]